VFENIPILSLLILFPLIGSIAVLLLGKSDKAAKYMALAFSAIPLVLSVLLLAEFNIANGGFQFEENYQWISFLGISLHLGIDGISMAMVFLTGLLVFLVILFSWDVEERVSHYMGLMLVLEVGLMGVFLALDYFVFYIFWEVVLIPMYFLVAIWGGVNRAYASIKFFIYTHVASLAMLLGIFALYFTTAPMLKADGLIPADAIGTFDMQLIASVAGGLGEALQIAIFAALFFGFIVKMPVVPFHTWLPDAHVQAPTAGSVLLAGLMLKMGSYGIVRIILPTLPDATQTFQILMAVIGVVSIIYGAFACLAQSDLKKMVAYSSISHMGIVLLGIATLTPLGIAAGVFQMFAHGLITAVLFMVCGMFQHKVGTREIPLLGGLAPKLPILATVMMMGFMASLGLPGMVGFLAEFSVFTATFDVWDVWVLVPIASVALTAAYYLWAMQRSIFGQLTDRIDTSHLHDSYWFETAPLAVLIGLIVLFGVWPAFVMDLITPTIPLVWPGVI